MKSCTSFSLRFSFFCLCFTLALAPAAWGGVTHTVKKGESLSTIGKRYHLSPSRILEANHLKSEKLKIGQRLTIPERPNKNLAKGKTQGTQKKSLHSDPRTGTPDIHTANHGETLAAAPQQYNLPAKDQRTANGTEEKPEIGRTPWLSGEEEQEDMEPGDGDEHTEYVVASAFSGVPFIKGLFPGKDNGDNVLVEVAKNFLGIKYLRGGTSLIQGLDCSAYVQKVFRVIGVDLPRTAREQFHMGVGVARDTLRLGDLVFFHPGKARRPGHVGIYIGNDQFIHSSVSKRKIRIDNLNTRYFATRFLGARRIQEAQNPPRAPEREARMEPSVIELASFPSSSAE